MRPAPPPFPWEAALRAGLGWLRLPPDAFWRMTPRELASALSALAPAHPPPLDRATLEALVRRFPDRA